MTIGICGWLTASYTYYIQSPDNKKAAADLPKTETETEEIENVTNSANNEDALLSILETIRAEQRKLRAELEKRDQEATIIFSGPEIKPLPIRLFPDPSTDYLPSPTVSVGGTSTKPSDYPLLPPRER